MSRTVGLMGIVATVALVCTACASQSPAGSSAPSSGTSTNLTKSPIVIGQLVSQTGVGASTFGTAPKTTQAWQAWVNSHGGIDGHPVQVEIKDDQSSGNVGLAATQSLVSSMHVIAMVGAFDPISEAASLPYLEQQQVALINGFPVLPQDFTSPVAYPVGQNYPDLVSSALEVVKAAGHRDLTLLACAETPSCAALDPVIKEAGPKVGVDYGGVLTVSASTTDYTAQCLKLEQDKATALWMATAETTTQKLYSNCGRQNYRPTYFFNGNAFTPDLLSISGMSALASNYTAPYFADIPALTDYHNAMRNADATSAESVISIDTWAALEIFRTALESYLSRPGAPTSPTAADVIKAMETVQDVDLGGILPSKISYSASDHHPSIKCQIAMGIADGKYTLPKGQTPICVGS